MCQVIQIRRQDQELLKGLSGTILEIGSGGKVVFIEHVAATADTVTRSAQRLLNLLWRNIADSCHPDRETWRLLKEAEIGELSFRRFKLKGALPIMAPHIMGTATKA